MSSIWLNGEGWSGEGERITPSFTHLPSLPLSCRLKTPPRPRGQRSEPESQGVSALCLLPAYPILAEMLPFCTCLIANFHFYFPPHWQGVGNFPEAATGFHMAFGIGAFPFGFFATGFSAPGERAGKMFCFENGFNLVASICP